MLSIILRVLKIQVLIWVKYRCRYRDRLASSTIAAGVDERATYSGVSMENPQVVGTAKYIRLVALTKQASCFCLAMAV
jgi:hypothetical protein